jgi:hypothetical protein
MQRNIKTHFYQNRKYHDPVQINSSTDANRAVAQCILHLQIARYDADSAEVYDDETGELHAQIKRNMHGDITILYKRSPADYETRLAIGALFGKDNK